MRNNKGLGYAVASVFGILFWPGVIVYSLYQLLNRIFNGGDIFPVLTTLLAISIIVRLEIIGNDFRKIVEWIRR